MLRGIFPEQRVASGGWSLAVYLVYLADVTYFF